MLAACGTPVVIHDETLDRTTDQVGRVAAIPWERLATVRLRTADGQVTEARLPRLMDVLATCAELGLSANVEIKPSAGAAELTGRTVARLCAQFVAQVNVPVLLTSFERPALDAAMQAAPQLIYGHLFDEPIENALSSACLDGCAHLVLGDATASETGVRLAMTKGYEVAVYTVNDPARARQLWSWGVAGVITDAPLDVSGADTESTLA